MTQTSIHLNDTHGPFSLTLENFFLKWEGTVDNFVVDQDYDGYVTLNINLVRGSGSALKVTKKKLKVSKAASVDVELPPSINEILEIKSSLGLPPAAVGTYKASNGKIVYKWEEEV